MNRRLTRKLTLTVCLCASASTAFATDADTLRKQIAAEAEALVTEADVCEDTDQLRHTLELLRSRRRADAAQRTECLRFTYAIYDNAVSPSSRALALAKSACQSEPDIEVLKLAFSVYENALTPSTRALRSALRDAADEKIEGQATCLEFAFPIRNAQTTPSTRAWTAAMEDCKQ